jgi:uncharacterized damage-inducible protein DinB
LPALSAGADYPAARKRDPRSGIVNGDGVLRKIRARRLTRAAREEEYCGRASRSHSLPCSWMRHAGSLAIGMALKDAVLAEFDHEMAATRKLLERLPEEKLTWQPHEKSRSLGALATHIGHIADWSPSILNEKSCELDTAVLQIDTWKSRQEILSGFDANATRARTLLDRTDAEYSSVWSLTRGGREVFSMPRIAAFRTFVLYHLVHHRGQLSVYLRLIDVPVPALYGPSADEG